MPPGTATPTAAEGAGLVISLYRSILRLHKDRLPPQLRSLGDAHARSEFQAHLRGRTTAEQWEQFYQAWRGYLLTLGGSDVQPRVGQLDDGTSQALAAASTTFAAVSGACCMGSCWVEQGAWGAVAWSRAHGKL